MSKAVWPAEEHLDGSLWVSHAGEHYRLAEALPILPSSVPGTSRGRPRAGRTCRSTACRPSPSRVRGTRRQLVRGGLPPITSGAADHDRIAGRLDDKVAGRRQVGAPACWRPLRRSRTTTAAIAGVTLTQHHGMGRSCLRRAHPRALSETRQDDSTLMACPGPCDPANAAKAVTARPSSRSRRARGSRRGRRLPATVPVPVPGLGRWDRVARARARAGVRVEGRERWERYRRRRRDEEVAGLPGRERGAPGQPVRVPDAGLVEEARPCLLGAASDAGSTLGTRDPAVREGSPVRIVGLDVAQVQEAAHYHRAHAAVLPQLAGGCVL